MFFVSLLGCGGVVGVFFVFEYVASAFSWLVGFYVAGHLLNTFCPDPEILRKSDPAQFEQWKAALAGEAALAGCFGRPLVGARGRPSGVGVFSP